MEAKVILFNQVDDPYLNLAMELYLVEHAEQPTLYLWRNSRTVVIGQNQNPYSEVNVEALEADGGHVMRRRTGGGAVYHDVGNLNFSFIMPHALYDLRRQFAVIQRAVESFGLRTELSGRNDILVDCGDSFRKFSGNAFSKGRVNDLHHGTLLIDGDMSDLQRYLRPNAAKLQKHGVQSVRSRVANLHDLYPDITVESIVPRLKASFAEVMGPVGYTEAPAVQELPSGVLLLRDELASDEWLYGRWRTFRASRSGQFPWGSVEVQLTVDDGVVRDVLIASDALDTDALDQASRQLSGMRLRDAVPPADGIVGDIWRLLTE